jgi:hypothetical protein
MRKSGGAQITDDRLGLSFAFRDAEYRFVRHDVPH